VARCQTAVSAPPSALPAAGGQVTLAVVAARECTWTAASEASWARISPSAGQGEGSVTLTAAANPEARTRTGSIVINDNRLSVAQEPAPCRYEVSPGALRLSQEGGRSTVQVSAPDGCAWTAASSQSWARVLTSSGSSGGTVPVEVSRNTGAARTATLTIAGRAVTVEQSGATAPPPPGGPTPPPAAPEPPPPPPPPPAGDDGEKTSVSGFALLVDGACPNVTFIVDFRRVFTTGDTHFKGNCRSLRNGSRVDVDGRMQSDGRIRATSVNIRGGDDDN
jgi:hypothetical protein